MIGKNKGRKIMNKKGQGALEYLLLIGGAIVVAVVVVTLLLNLGSAGSGSTDATTMGVICSQKAAISGATPSACNNVNSQGATTAYIWDSKSGRCWQCGGTYSASCSATKQAATTSGFCCSTPGPAGSCSANNANSNQSFLQI